VEGEETAAEIVAEVEAVSYPIPGALSIASVTI
jgi:hypothetical protein